MLKKLTLFCLIFILVAFLYPLDLRAERCISVQPDMTVTTIGTIFSLEVAVNDTVESLMGYDITIAYDDSHLQIVDVEEGSLPADSGEETFFSWLNSGCDCDSILVNGSILGATINGPGALFTMTFKAIKVGSVDVSIQRSDIRDGDNQKLSHRREHTTVVIEQPIGTEKSTWSSLKYLYR
jgi:hypothetical protein